MTLYALAGLQCDYSGGCVGLQWCQSSGREVVDFVVAIIFEDFSLTLFFNLVDILLMGELNSVNAFIAIPVSFFCSEEG